MTPIVNKVGLTKMPTTQQHLQNVIESAVGPVSTMVTGAAATGTIAVWATQAQQSLHAGAQTAIDLSAYAALIWFAVQIVCKIYVTFFKKEAPGHDVEE